MGSARGFTDISPDTRWGSSESGYGYYGNYTLAERFTMPGSGTYEITEMGVYVRVPSTSRTCKFAIFTDDSTNTCPESMVTNSLSDLITISETSQTKKYHSYSTKPQVTGGVNYWLCMIFNSTSAYYVYPSDDKQTSSITMWRNDTFPTFPTGATWHSHYHLNRITSLYAVYSAPSPLPIFDYYYNNMRP